MSGWTGMIAYALLLGLVLWVAARVLLKAGFSPWWALLLVLPVLAVAGLWLFAFIPWPRIDRVRTTPPSDYEGGWDIPQRDESPDREKPGGDRR
jgi:hypothetical protein